ncbi:DUF421 domain-containing protein [Ornithinicoccus halotolerans]|uniref:DUF421 domain-containing protein n=1 Tax=Ornithinicoccus halotolerans TaxID=1748220 RepID=UPI00129742D5|nr:YetF domain-containing protein [Ornithinicoccus halotolerans]
MWELIGITPLGALAVVVSVLGIYATVLCLVRVLGQRSVAALSGFDLAAIITFGSVSGRAILGHSPTLAGGVIALVTLFTVQALVGQARRTRAGDRVVTNQALLLMSGHEVVQENLDRAHIVTPELHSRLRLAGVRTRSEVAAVILERSGAISVIRRGEPIEAALLADVRGADLLPARLVSGRAEPRSPAPDPAAAPERTGTVPKERPR